MSVHRQCSPWVFTMSVHRRWPSSLVFVRAVVDPRLRSTRPLFNVVFVDPRRCSTQRCSSPFHIVVLNHHRRRSSPSFVAVVHRRHSSPSLGIVVIVVVRPVNEKDFAQTSYSGSHGCQSIQLSSAACPSVGRVFASYHSACFVLFRSVAF